MPSDIKEYFLKINGADEGFFGLRSLKDWCRFPDRKYYSEYDDNPFSYPIDEYFLIGTYDIHVWYWLMRLHPDPSLPTPVIATHQKETIVAGNFSQFLQKWRLDNGPHDLLGP